MRNLNDPWDVICERAGLEDTHIHDCRHSYASRALALGKGLPMIGRLLGHSEVQTTERYAHLDGQWVKESAERISDIIGTRILSGYAGRLDRVSPGPGTGAPDEEAENRLSPFSARYRARTSTAV